MEKNENNYITLYHRYRNIKTVKEFMDREHIYNITPEDFFELNRDLIWSQYSWGDKRLELVRSGKWIGKASDLSVDSFLPCPCNLKIQASKVTSWLSISQTNFQSEYGDYYAFASDEIADIIQDEGYQIGSSEKKNPKARVFGWFKSMYHYGLTGDNNFATLGKKSSEFADLSKYIMSLSTLVTKNGGSFTIKLPIINANYFISGLLDDKDNPHSFAKVSTGGLGNEFIRNTYRFNNEFYSKNEYGNLESNYFNWLISSNDILFISFEELDMEKQGNERDSDKFDLRTIISDQVYDLIGLVDTVTVMSDASGANGYVEVVGRDLMKLLIDDGSFFFNPSTTSDPSQVFVNEQSYGKQGDIREADQINNTYNNPINRLRRVTGEIDIFANRINMDLGFILKGVISQLANVEIVPSYVFDSWGVDRTTFLELQPKEGSENGNS